MPSQEYYQTIGLTERWEVHRAPQWRGWEVLGFQHDENGEEIIVFQFLPDAAIDVLLKEIEKAKTNKSE